MHSYHVIRLDDTISTNSHVTALLSGKSISMNSVVTAKYQSGGKGQGDNTWVSEYGKNLICSILVSPAFLKPHEQFRLSKITALAINDALHDLNLKGTIKWPNDTIVHKKKIAGILIENVVMNDSILSSVIGIGLNVNQKDFSALSDAATSIVLETGIENDPDVVLNILLEKFEFWYQKLAMGETEDVDIEYLENLYGLNREFSFRMGSRVFKATITGVGESGRLFLRREDGKILKAAFREIEFL